MAADEDTIHEWCMLLRHKKEAMQKARDGFESTIQRAHEAGVPFTRIAKAVEMSRQAIMERFRTTKGPGDA